MGLGGSIEVGVLARHGGWPEVRVVPIFLLPIIAIIGYLLGFFEVVQAH